MTVSSFTFDQLRVSPLNVRTNTEDAEATAALEASIAVRGLLFPLVVHPMDDGVMGVLAGGRRLRAIGRLIDAGRLPPDWPIEALVRDVDPAEITELSLAENLLRRELRPYEVHAAIARARQQGATPEEIAENLGQRLVWVNQQLRLGNLAPEIFAAYAAGDISVDQAQAYAATEDHAAQRATWSSLRALHEYQHTAHKIRQALKIGDYELAKLLRFVGADVYRAVGGGFELDLFDDAEKRGRVLDEGVLRELAENKLAHRRNQVRLAAGDRDLRFAAMPPQFSGGTDPTLEILPKSRTVDGEKVYTLPKGDVIATLDILDDGDTELRWWWASRKAKADASRAAGPAGEKVVARLPAGHPAQVHDDSGFTAASNFVGAQAARAAVKAEHGLTGDGLHAMRSIRRELLRALLVRDAADGGTLGRDYLVWAQLRQELGDDRDRHAGARGLASSWHGSEEAEPVDFVRPQLQAIGAHKLWEDAVAEIAAQPFMAISNPSESFAAFVCSTEEERGRAGAVLAGLALLRSANVAGWRIAAHDRLAALAGGSDAALREDFTPTAELLGMFPKLQRLTLAQPYVQPSVLTGWSKVPDRALSNNVSDALRDIDDWVHPLLSFGAGAPVDPSADQLEAAE